MRKINQNKLNTHTHTLNRSFGKCNIRFGRLRWETIPFKLIQWTWSLIRLLMHSSCLSVVDFELIFSLIPSIRIAILSHSNLNAACVHFLLLANVKFSWHSSFSNTLRRLFKSIQCETKDIRIYYGRNGIVYVYREVALAFKAHQQAPHNWLMTTTTKSTCIMGTLANDGERERARKKTDDEIILVHRQRHRKHPNKILALARANALMGRQLLASHYNWYYSDIYLSQVKSMFFLWKLADAFKSPQSTSAILSVVILLFC